MGGGYDRQLVQYLLPIVADLDALAWGLKNETAPDCDMPRAVVKKKKESSYPALVADIRHAWARRVAAGLSLEEQQAVYLHHCLDMTQEEAGRLIGTGQRRVSRLAERGVGKLTAFLNGVRYVDGYDEAPQFDAA